MLHATSGSQPAPAQWSLPASTMVCTKTATQQNQGGDWPWLGSLMVKCLNDDTNMPDSLLASAGKQTTQQRAPCIKCTRTAAPNSACIALLPSQRWHNKVNAAVSKCWECLHTLNTRHVTPVGLPAVLLLHDACRHSCCCCTHREHDRLPARAAATAAAAADTLHKALPEASPSPAAATKGLIRLQMCCLQRKAVIPRQQRQSATPHTPTPTLSQPTFL
jgi:hypothetical protein